MRNFRKTPLAWLQLTRNKVRLVVAIMGITFATVLMFMQLAFLNSLYDSQTAIHKRLKGDLVLINANVKTMVRTDMFSRQYLYRTMNLPEVESVNYLYHGQQSFRYGDTISGKGIIIIGINPLDAPIQFPDSDRLLPLLKTIGVVLFDRNSSRKAYGNIVADLDKGTPLAAEFNGKKVKVAGTVDFSGSSFSDDGNLISSSTTFSQLTGRSADAITLGLINLKPGTNLEEGLKKVKSLLPASISAMTMQDFIEYEKSYWTNSAPIGFVFGIGVFVGFLVGVVIVYQILFNEVTDHLPDYALLKARGYKHRYFVNILFQEALIIAVLGYIPGFILTVALYAITKQSTSLPIAMTFPRAMLVLGLTMGMCIFSGAISMRKLKEADPAELFS